MPKGQPSGERIVWDDTNEKHLLLCILADANPTKLDWARIAERFGKNLTSGAASQKYSKVKTRDKELFGNGAAATSTTLSKAKKDTPSKASVKRASNGKTKQAVPISEDSEDEELFETPSKKVKMAKEEETSDDMGSAMEEE